MSLSFGLNTRSRAPASPPKPKRRPVAMDVLDDDSDHDTPAAAAPKSNVFEEELTEFDASKPSRPSAPALAPKKKPLNKLKPGSIPTKPPTRKPQGVNPDEYSDLSAQRESAAYAAQATELDPTIYDYDS
ncbi:hypothetical protein KCU73_g15340, partial [Aureobasidium melanogenum]